MSSSLLKKTPPRKPSIFKEKAPPKLHPEKSIGKYQHLTSQCDPWRTDKSQVNPSLKNLQKRYRELEHEYKNVLEEIQQKNTLYEDQQKEVQRLKKEHEKDQKQLFRLRSMLGFIKKNDIGLQVNLEQGSRRWMAKIQKSTQDNFQKQASINEMWTPKKSKRTSSPSSKIKSPIDKNKINGTMYQRTQKKRYEGYKKKSILKDNPVEELFPSLSEKTIKHPISKSPHIYHQNSSLLRQIKKITNSPYSKLRFVPSPDLS